MDMVERVARAICPADDWTVTDFDDLSRDGRARFVAMARAAIAAMREPTPEMLKAGNGAMLGRMRDATLGGEGALKVGWQAMVGQAAGDLSVPAAGSIVGQSLAENVGEAPQAAESGENTGGR
jgi:hypothetical protein